MCCVPEISFGAFESVQHLHLLVMLGGTPPSWTKPPTGPWPVRHCACTDSESKEAAMSTSTWFFVWASSSPFNKWICCFSQSEFTLTWPLLPQHLHCSCLFYFSAPERFQGQSTYFDCGTLAKSERCDEMHGKFIFSNHFSHTGMDLDSVDVFCQGRHIKRLQNDNKALYLHQAEAI